MTRTLLCAALLAHSAVAATTSYSGIRFFGDSLSDTGNVYATTSILSAATLGLVPVQPPSPPYFNGRFSNGPVWTERFAQRLDAPGAAAPAGMSLGVFGSLPGTGGNYAIGGARTGTGGALGPLDALIPTGVLAQTQFHLSQFGGTADPNALYVLLGGGNDLRDAAALNDAALRQGTAVQAATYLAYSAYTLYAAGARNILLINAPNIGFIPESFASGRVNQGAEASVYFNGALDAYRQAFETLPGLELQFFDLFGLYNELVVDTANGGAQFGFTSVTPCINPGPGVPSCDASLFFDDIHPTARVHQLFGDRVADSVLGFPSGMTLSARFLSAPVPEPGTCFLAGAGLLLVVLRRSVTGKRTARLAPR